MTRHNKEKRSGSYRHQMTLPKVYSYITKALLLIILFFCVNRVNFLVQENVFNSPDESSTYLSVKEYGTKNKLRLTEKYAEQDSGNAIHPRGFITHEGKVVPFNFLGQYQIYGTFYTYFGDDIKRINNIIFLALLCLVYTILHHLGARSNRGLKVERIHLLIAFLGALPVLYYVSFSYYNIVLILPFMLGVVYALMRFYETKKWRYWTIATISMVMIVRIRYEQVLFLLLLVCFFGRFFHKKHRESFLFYGKILSWTVFVGAVVFLVPLMLFNHNLYGKYLTYGYSLFSKTYFAGERTGTVMKSIINIFLPGSKLDLPLLRKNITNHLRKVSPLYFLAGYRGLYKTKLAKKLSWFRIVIAYILLYQGMSPTFGSGTDIAYIHSSINRYWMVAHLLIILGVYYFFHEKKKIGYVLTYLFFISICFSLPQLIQEQNKYIRDVSSHEDYVTMIPEGSYVLSPIHDKILAQHARMIGRWCGVDCLDHFEKNKDSLATTMLQLLTAGEQVYAIQSGRLTKQYHFAELERRGLVFKHYHQSIYIVSAKRNEKE